MRVNPYLESFNAGELSPWLWGRTSFAKYPYGLETCENLIPVIEGAVTRRPGTRYIAAVKDSTKTVKLIDFIFSTIQAYVLEFGDGYIRFYRHQGQIQTSGVSGWVTVTAYVIGDLVIESGTTYYCKEAHTSGTFATDLAAGKWYAQSGTIYEIPIDYAEADLTSLRYTQSADVLYTFHPNYITKKLTRSAHTTWTHTDVTFTDGPYLDVNATATTLAASATTGSVTITASAVTGINDGDGFKATDIGRLIRLSNPAAGTDWGYCTITAFTDTTHVTATVNRDFLRTNASVDWALGAWSDTTGFPKVGVFFQERLVLASTTSQPQTIWFSQTDDFENFSPDSPDSSDVWDGTVNSNDAFSRTISSDKVNSISWLASLRKLVIGTTGGEYSTLSEGASLTPTDIQIIRNTDVGCLDTPPAIIGNRVLFIQSAKRKLYELGFSFDDDAYRQADLSRLSRHITYGGISELFYSREPYNMVCCKRSDGNLACMTYNREEDVVSWFPLTTAGTFERGTSIPGANGAGQVQNSETRDEIWVVVNRTIESTTKRYIEMFERDFETGDDQEDAYYADSLLTYDSTSTSTISGLGHLEGESVVVWADGYKQDTKTVASGSITLDNAASVVQVGLAYSHKFKSLKLNYGAALGTAVGKPKKVHGLTFVLLNTHLVNYGIDENNLTLRDLRVVSDAMDEAVDLYTGEYSVDFDGEVDRDSRIYMEDNSPAPFTLISIAPEMRTSEL